MNKLQKVFSSRSVTFLRGEFDFSSVYFKVYFICDISSSVGASFETGFAREISCRFVMKFGVGMARSASGSELRGEALKCFLKYSWSKSGPPP